MPLQSYSASHLELYILTCYNWQHSVYHLQADCFVNVTAIINLPFIKEKVSERSVISWNLCYTTNNAE